MVDPGFPKEVLTTKGALTSNLLFGHKLLPKLYKNDKNGLRW